MSLDWQRELAIIDDLMKRVSREPDPQKLVRLYTRGVAALYPRDRVVSISRRGLSHPEVRVTRDTDWKEEINPWRQQAQLPLIRGGILAEFVYSDAPLIINDFTPDPADPGFEFLKGARSLCALPQYEDGVSINMAIVQFERPDAIDATRYPNMLWQANLFGRATANLVLRAQLTEAYAAIDRELQVVGEIQRSLLPRTLPTIPGLDLAAFYQTSQRAGGDYYDVFPLTDGRFGLFIADVSGHGTPAAVLMAITHAIAHTFPGQPAPPGAMLTYLNRVLTALYTQETGNFVTAFYALYDPNNRSLVSACAGHPPPRLRRGAEVRGLDGDAGLPLGIIEEIVYTDREFVLERGDELVMYTDGVTEAADSGGDLYGEPRLDANLRAPHDSPEQLIGLVREALEHFTSGRVPADDRTILAARVV